MRDVIIRTYDISIKFESSRFEQKRPALKACRQEAIPYVRADESKMQNRISSPPVCRLVFARIESEIEVADTSSTERDRSPASPLARIFKLNSHEIEVSRGKKLPSFSPSHFRLGYPAILSITRNPLPTSLVVFNPLTCQLNEIRYYQTNDICC